MKWFLFQETLKKFWLFWIYFEFHAIKCVVKNGVLAVNVFRMIFGKHCSSTPRCLPSKPHPSRLEILISFCWIRKQFVLSEGRIRILSLYVVLRSQKPKEGRFRFQTEHMIMVYWLHSFVKVCWHSLKTTEPTVKKFEEFLKGETWFKRTKKIFGRKMISWFL